MRKISDKECQERVDNSHGKNKYKLISFVNIREKSIWKHIENNCGYQFEIRNATPFMNGKCGCPICSVGMVQNTDTYKTRVQRVCGEEYSVIGEYKNANTKITMRHNNCSCEKGFFEWDVTPHMFLDGGHRCPYESHQVEVTTESFAKRLHKINSKLELISEYKNSGTKVLIKCNICNGIFDTTPENVTVKSRKYQCPYCTNHRVLKGFNDISTTHPHVFNILKDKEFGYTHFYYTHEKTIGICPDCGNEVLNYPSLFFNEGNSFVCPSCKDGFSYPEKYVLSMLKQLGVKFKYQLTNGDFEWCGKYRYDFYFNNCIIETHGGQHYRDTNWMSLDDIKANDLAKKNLAITNGIINYIELDCSESNPEFIKNSILSSKLSKLYDLTNIDWIKCGLDASKNILKEICSNWDNSMTIPDYAKLFGVSDFTIKRYLKIGTNLGICNFDFDEYKKSTKDIRYAKTAKTQGVPVYCHELNRIFYSVSKARREVGLHSRNELWGNPNRTSQGYHWSYVSQLSEDFIKEHNLLIK